MPVHATIPASLLAMDKIRNRFGKGAGREIKFPFSDFRFVGKNCYPFCGLGACLGTFLNFPGFKC
jgi:hypothetical protein